MLDLDRILVMDTGHVVELGAPIDLLRDEESHFSKLVAADAQASCVNKNDAHELFLPRKTSDDVREGKPDFQKSFA